MFYKTFWIYLYISVSIPTGLPYLLLDIWSWKNLQGIQSGLLILFTRVSKTHDIIARRRAANRCACPCCNTQPLNHIYLRRCVHTYMSFVIHHRCMRFWFRGGTYSLRPRRSPPCINCFLPQRRARIVQNVEMRRPLLIYRQLRWNIKTLLPIKVLEGTAPLYKKKR